MSSINAFWYVPNGKFYKTLMLKQSEKKFWNIVKRTKTNQKNKLNNLVTIFLYNNQDTSPYSRTTIKIHHMS